MTQCGKIQRFMKQPKLVAGNWKMNGSRASNRALLDAVLEGIVGLAGVECAVCVPFPYLGEVAERLRGSPVPWGAQNVSEHARGAYTGEVSAGMLVEFACRYVIVGHSERRQLYGETDAQVAERLVLSLRTVHSHLRSIYRKLDVRSRSAATRYAVEHGLADDVPRAVPST